MIHWIYFKLISIILFSGLDNAVARRYREKTIVQNLDQILQSLRVTPRRHYVAFTNYQNEGIPDTTIPFIVRNMHFFTQFEGNRSGEDLKDLPYPVDYYTNKDCIVPNNLDKSAAYSKMWEGPLQIEFFPREDNLDKLTRYCYHRVKQMHIHAHAPSYELPFPTVSVSIIISYEDSKFDHEVLEKWMNPKSDGMRIPKFPGTQLNQNIFLKMEVQEDKQEINEITLLMPCGYCSTMGLGVDSIEKLELGKMPSKEFLEGNIWRKLSAKYTSFRWTGNWMTNDWKKPRARDGISKFMISCPSRKNVFEGMRHLQDYQRYDAIVSEIILSIMINKTYHLSYLFNCDNGILKRVDRMSSARSAMDTLSPQIECRKIPKLDAHMRHQLSIENSQSGLRFVACGIRGVQSFRFAELYRIYDMCVYIATLGSIAVLSAVSVGYGSNLITIKTAPTYLLKWLGHNLRFMKVLLEQRDPFPVKMSSNSVIRWLLTGFLLAAIVLSKAYRGTNVYNVVRPRPALLYETLNHLIQDGFSIYTRIASVDIRIPWRKVDKLSYTIRNHFASLGAEGQFGSMMFIKTEISEMISSQLEVGHNDQSGTMKLLQEYTRMHLSIPYLMNDIGRSIVEYSKDKKLDRRAAEESLSRKFMDWERELYWRDLGMMCNKTAIIMPGGQSRKYARIMSYIGMHAVSVGSEVYGEGSLAIDVKGYAPFNTLDRICRLKESGITEWLPRLARGNDGSGDKETSWPMSASMKGNIAVIFIVLLVGAGKGLVCFLLENARRLGRLKMFSRKKFQKSCIIRVESAVTRDDNMTNLDQPCK